ncbi:MAG: transglutaminase domain-containing protein [Acutalibacteraceae bacterium]|nr:transglutaminase domain-containing protein [Acutalibacteraceae bacterium]
MKSKISKAVSVIISLSLCVMLGGCKGVEMVAEIVSGKSADNYNQIKTITAESEYTEIELNYAYNSLENDEEKQLYKEIESVVNAVSNEEEDGLYSMQEIELKGVNLTEGAIRVVIEAFNCDHPEVFWISNTFGYYSDKKMTMVHLYSEFGGADINIMQAKLNNEIQSFISDMPLGLSEYEREKFIHDKLINNCVYDVNADASQGVQSAFTMYGALVEKSAVCEGYTKAMQYLLKLVGIESITVNGYSKSELHQWCMVNVDDKWYHLDITWDDQDANEDHEASVLYTYFNTTDSYIESDHKIARTYTHISEADLCGKDGNDAVLFNLPLPRCDSKDAFYFNMDGAMFTAFDDYDCYDSIVNKLYNASMNKEGSFSIKISEELDYNDTIDKLFYNEPYEFFEYTADVNKMMDTDYRIKDNLSIITYEEQGLVQIQLKYE